MFGWNDITNAIKGFVQRARDALSGGLNEHHETTAALLGLGDYVPPPHTPPSSTSIAPGFQMQRRTPIVLSLLWRPAVQVHERRPNPAGLHLVIGRSLGNINPGVYERAPNHATLRVASETPLAPTGTDESAPVIS
jgi:hypothetical protein